MYKILTTLLVLVSMMLAGCTTQDLPSHHRSAPYFERLSFRTDEGHRMMELVRLVIGEERCKIEDQPQGCALEAALQSSLDDDEYADERCIAKRHCPTAEEIVAMWVIESSPGRIYWQGH